nr:alpha/beta hydrolases superfamily protein [Tanacetum cinerariifolium]
MTIEQSKDLTSLSLDELIGNLKVHEMIIKKDSERVKAKGERKSLALKAKKESNNKEYSTSISEDEEYAIVVRDFKKVFKGRAILSGADNCPPMLEKDMYDSGKSKIELYMLNRQHGRMILESYENGPLLLPTVEENKVTRPKKYFELSAKEAIQAEYDYGSPYHSSQYESYAQTSTPFSITYPSNDFQSSVRHNIYNPSSSIPQVEYAPSVHQQYDFSQPDTGLVVLVFQKGDDPIDAINHMMSFFTVFVTSRQHGRMILESYENGPLLLPTVEENRVTRPKKYFELSAKEAIQAEYDVKATNIILQGLPPEVYALVSNHKVTKELWEIIQLLMQGTSLTKQERS